MIRVDADKLQDIRDRRGFSNYEGVAKKAKLMGIELGLATIYNIRDNNNWTRKSLEALCLVLECDPRDFVYFEREAPKAIAPIRLSGETINAVV